MNDDSQRLPHLEKRHVEKLQAVFISHLHQDHVGALSLLVAYDYQGPVILSEITADWLSSELPLNFCPFELSQAASWQTVTEALQFLWGNSGHVIGSVWYSVVFHHKHIFFSGDVSLTSPLYPIDFPPRLTYDVAFIDSGNAGQQISNLNSKETMRQIIEQGAFDRFKIESKFTSKCLEILIYFYQTTTIPLLVDQVIYQWLQFHWKHRANLLLKARNELQDLLASPRLKRIATNDEKGGVYFVSNEQFALRKMNERLNHLPFKNHLDTNEIYYVSNYLGARQTIYFHSQACTPQTTLSEIIKLNQ
jgi:Cft2 family RNA processing exonuclease